MPPFPLPLTPFEHFMLAVHRPECPMTVTFRLRYSGNLDRQRLQQAVDFAIRLNPLLRARVVGHAYDPTRQLKWVASRKEVSIQWLDDGGWTPEHGLDLGRGSGLRIAVSDHDVEPYLLIQCHHACADGVGILHFIETFLLAYRDGSSLTDNEDPLGLRRNRHWWRTRSRSGTTVFKDLLRSHRDLARIISYFRTPTAPLANSHHVASLDSGDGVNDAFCAATLKREESERLSAAAKLRRVSLNDLLLRDFFWALEQWNGMHRVALRGKALRVAVPINLRVQDVSLAPAVNGVSMVFLDRSPEQIRESESLLATIHDEMVDVKRWGTGWAMIRVLRAAGCVSGGMLRLASWSGPSVSSGLSNLGRVFTQSPLANGEGKLEARGIVMEGLELFSPVRPGVHVVAAALTYASRLTVTVNYDHGHFSRAAADQLLGIFMKRLRCSVT